jgi:ssDNA-specific exonuclease RecJ
MLLAYRFIQQGGFDCAGAAKALGVSAEKCAFILRVFEELELIEHNGSGRIHAIKASKKELRQSVTYRSFQDYITEPQKS